MNKTQVLKALKGMHNNTKEINSLYIRRVCYHKNQWQIVDSLDFDTAKIVKEFYYQAELADYIAERTAQVKALAEDWFIDEDKARAEVEDFASLEENQ